MKIFSERLVSGKRLVWEKSPSYEGDGLRVWNKSVGFLDDSRFRKAYDRGMNSGHRMGGGNRRDLHIEWRIHTALWAAKHAVNLPGSFVECGVNTGITSVSICEYLDFNSLDRDFYLFDTFCGIPYEQRTQEERQDEQHARKMGQLYEECYELAKKNFSEFRRAYLIRGKVPETLNQVSIEKVCYLSIDMNIVYPEIAAIRHFWDRLVPGAIVLLDDYGWKSHILQKQAMDEFAAENGTSVLELPTGQGVIIRP